MSKSAKISAPDRDREPTLAAWFNTGAIAFESVLEQALVAHALRGPARLEAALRHAVLGGGKRLRPYLVLQSMALMGATATAAAAVAASLEFLHCYSLVHDDLPAMDDDDLRRGRPTLHRAFDEATAILAGDALQAMAFALLADPATGLEPAAALRLTAALAEASGPHGMVGGQLFDLAAEQRFGPVEGATGASAVIRIQSMKTGALFRYAALTGPLVAGTTGPDMQALATFGEALGLAFQIRDDLIDVEGDATTAGKVTGKDAGAGKATFVTELGLDGARRRLAEVSAAGEAALAPFGAAAGPLSAILAFNLDRMA